MGSHKLGIFCKVTHKGSTASEEGWFFMHYKGYGWFFFPDKNCGYKQAVTSQLSANPSEWNSFDTAGGKEITNIVKIADLSSHRMLRG